MALHWLKLGIIDVLEGDVDLSVFIVVFLVAMDRIVLVVVTATGV